MFSRSGSAALEELQLLQQKVSLLERKNSELNHELKERDLSCEQLVQRALAAQVQLEKDQLMLKLESAHNRKSWDDIENADTDQDVDLMKSYILKIQQLEGELMQQKFSTTCRNGLHDRIAMDKDMLLDHLCSGCEVGTPNAASAIAISVANPTVLVKVRVKLQAEGKLAPGVPWCYAGGNGCLCQDCLVGRGCCFVDWPWTERCT